MVRQIAMKTARTQAQVLQIDKDYHRARLVSALANGVSVSWSMMMLRPIDGLANIASDQHPGAYA